ncbi:MAG TPA: hypothetical protein VM925_16665 [Labilithrix sp.]|jgi:hypothetical protein|nr:hypothetical protein [Labilithrix sp.]
MVNTRRSHDLAGVDLNLLVALDALLSERSVLRAALANFRYRVQSAWIKWLRRRSNSTPLTWERAYVLLERYPLPPARIPRRHAVT